MSLSIDTRLYNLVRQAVSNIPEALVELITNSLDAYTQSINSKKIYITIDEKKRTVCVRDEAIGMNGEEMINRLLVVGRLTAHNEARGMMGRGAKDISNIGDITFTGVKDKKKSQVSLNHDMSTVINYIDNDTDEINSFEVNIMVNKTVIFHREEELRRRLSLNYLLRPYLLSSDCYIYLNDIRLLFETRKSKKVLELEYVVDEYNCTAKFIVYKTEKVLPFPKSDLEGESGILVRSSRGVFENSSLFAQTEQADIVSHNPGFRFITGELICDTIEDIARQEERTDNNPFFLLDSSRRTGLNRKHPFTQALFNIPYQWLTIILSRIQDENDDFLNVGKDIEDLLKEVSEEMNETIPPESMLYTWRSKGEQQSLDLMKGKIKSLEVNQEMIGFDDDMIKKLRNNEETVPRLIKNENIGKARYEIKITNNPLMRTSYETQYYPSRIVVKINAHDEAIEPFAIFEEDPNKIDITGEGAMVAVCTVLREAIIDMKTRNYLLNPVNVNVSTTNHLNEIRQIQNDSKEEISDSIKSLFNKIHRKFYPSKNDPSNRHFKMHSDKEPMVDEIIRDQV